MNNTLNLSLKNLSLLVAILLIAIAVPTSFVGAQVDLEVEDVDVEVADVVIDLVSGCTDSKALNFDDSATTDDGSCTYPVQELQLVVDMSVVEDFKKSDEYCPSPELVRIEMCKFNVEDGVVPMAGWGMILTNGDGLWHELTTGEDGCVSVEVDPAVGPWEAIEEDREGWQQDSVSVGNGIVYINQPENAEACRFFEEASEEVKIKAFVVDEEESDEITHRCDFFNEPIPEEVPVCTPELNGGFADKVEAFNQADRKDGSDVIAERSSSTDALGTNDWIDGGSTGFLSLGFGGSMIVSFDSYVPNVAGNDISIFEATNGTYPAETALVEVSQNGTTWLSVGTATNPGESAFDFDSTGYEWIKFVRLTDTSNPALHSNDADAFDVDAVKATQTVCRQPEDEDEDPEPVVDTYIIKGYVWHDDNTNTLWDLTEEQQESLVNESENPLAGWTVNITNGSSTFSTTTDEYGFYYFEVPAGTWTITEVVQEGWEITTQESHVVTVPAVVTMNVFDSIMNYLVPVAHAAVLGTYGDYNFGNNESVVPTGSSSRGSGGSRKATPTVAGDSISVPEPEPLVLGEQVSVMPYGAPGAGHGGASAQSIPFFIGQFLLAPRRTQLVK